MAFAEDLLDLARSLADLDGEMPRQASLRRAVSTAYYALFHLLISDATLNWSRPELRPAIGRLFEHGKMKQASEGRVSALKISLKDGALEERATVAARHLLLVANAFVRAHQQREDADYDTSRVWARTEVLDQIDSVAEAFRSWQSVRTEPEAQAYLVSLLGKRAR